MNKKGLPEKNFQTSCIKQRTNSNHMHSDDPCQHDCHKLHLQQNINSKFYVETSLNRYIVVLAPEQIFTYVTYYCILLRASTIPIVTYATIRIEEALLRCSFLAGCVILP
ncbi:hypothetical protein ACOSQ3_030597 [Xanthoceras sorbifolium]